MRVALLALALAASVADMAVVHHDVTSKAAILEQAAAAEQKKERRDEELAVPHTKAKHEEESERGEKEGNGTKHGDGCECECSWVSKDKKMDMCATDGDHSCCWHVCCKGIGGFTVTVTETATSTATQTETETSTSTHTTTRTETTTKTETTTRTTTETSTSTKTSTSTETTTTATTTTRTSTATTTSTTTEYCFEDDIFWDPLDMSDQMPKAETDAFACQRRCLRTDGCSHFAFHKMTSMCHLQDAFAVKRSSQTGYLSGPFQCGSYVKPDMFTKVANNSWLPKEFHCMQTGVAYSPDIAAPKHIQGNRAHVVKSCQELCAETEGCSFFTVHFSGVQMGMCRLAGPDATPLPFMASVMSGPAVSDCDQESVYMLKDSLLRQGQKQISPQHHAAPAAWTLAAATAAALLGATAMGVVSFRRHRHVVRALYDADLEESLATATSPASQSAAE
jgi:hypothetical protein